MESSRKDRRNFELLYRKAVTSNMWCPSLFVLASPHLHCLRVALDAPIFPIEMQFPIYDPGNVRKLDHRDSDITHGNPALQFLACSDPGNEVLAMCIGHEVAATQI